MSKAKRPVSESTTIILPLPPRVLSPNRPPGSRGGRMKKAAAAKRYRKVARQAAVAAQVDSSPWVRVTVQATFYHKQNRRRDDVNHLAMLKPAYDGLVESGLLADDDSTHLMTLPARFEIDREHPRVELLVERKERL